MDPANPDNLELKEKTIALNNINGLSFKDGMEAGSKYSLLLEFKEKSLNLTLVRVPWKMDYADMDYSSSSILARASAPNEGVLWLYSFTGNYPDDGSWVAGPRSREITLRNDRAIMGEFYIEAPTSGTWQITTYPAEAAQYFTVEPSSGPIEDLVYEDGHFNGHVIFYIKPRGAVPSQQVLHMNVDILLNGQWRNANTEFNRKDWRVTRDVE